MALRHSTTLNLALFGRWTLRDDAKQRRTFHTSCATQPPPRGYGSQGPGLGVLPKYPGLRSSIRVLRSHIGIRPQKPCAAGASASNTAVALVQ